MVFRKEGMTEARKERVSSNKWMHESSMPTERMRLTAILLGDKIHVLAGQNNDSSSGLIAFKINEVFHINKNSTKTNNDNE